MGQNLNHGNKILGEILNKTKKERIIKTIIRLELGVDETKNYKRADWDGSDIWCGWEKSG